MSTGADAAQISAATVTSRSALRLAMVTRAPRPAANRAVALAPQVRQALELVAGMLQQPGFDPRTAKDRLIIAATW
jgi:hypothetical protein